MRFRVSSLISWDSGRPEFLRYDLSVWDLASSMGRVSGRVVREQLRQPPDVVVLRAEGPAEGLLEAGPQKCGNRRCLICDWCARPCPECGNRRCLIYRRSSGPRQAILIRMWKSMLSHIFEIFSCKGLPFCSDCAYDSDVDIQAGAVDKIRKSRFGGGVVRGLR